MALGKVLRAGVAVSQVAGASVYVGGVGLSGYLLGKQVEKQGLNVKTVRCVGAAAVTWPVWVASLVVRTRPTSTTSRASGQRDARPP